MRRIHFIGICGTAMATLAALLKARGHQVQGSDAHVYPPMSDFLAREGITVFDGYSPEHLDPGIDLVVVGNAISRGNPELEAVLDGAWRYASLPETIRDEFLWDAEAVVVAGTHGKTTTTAIAAWLLTSRRARSVDAGRRHRHGTSATAAPAIGWAPGAPSSSKATSTTAPTSTRPPSS